MDGDLYDEFGNYIGPELESDDSSVDDEAEEPQDEEVKNSVVKNNSLASQTPPPRGNEFLDLEESLVL